MFVILEIENYVFEQNVRYAFDVDMGWYDAIGQKHPHRCLPNEKNIGKAT